MRKREKIYLTYKTTSNETLRTWWDERERERKSGVK
jgi:hypothetical protein